tara:strand:+ start:6385 stop:6684 length:300 start_codon:yes stop_codon:yes gene_type:complete
MIIGDTAPVFILMALEDGDPNTDTFKVRSSVDAENGFGATLFVSRPRGSAALPLSGERLVGVVPHRFVIIALQQPLVELAGRVAGLVLQNIFLKKLSCP